jgi:sugar (pentulose or hexulose) kinase
LFGLALAHGQADIIRAVLEGCAFQLRRIIESCELRRATKMVVVGGGAKSTLWLDIIADVTGHTLFTPRVVETGALGAAILAGVGVGVYANAHKAARRLVRLTGCHKPDQERQHMYNRVFQSFLDVENRVAPVYGKVPLASQAS